MKKKSFKTGENVCVHLQAVNDIVASFVEGKVMSVYREAGNDFAEVYTVNGPVCVKLDEVYSPEDAKEIVAAERQKLYYEETATVNSLLNFIAKHADPGYDWIACLFRRRGCDEEVVLRKRVSEALAHVDSEHHYDLRKES